MSNLYGLIDAAQDPRLYDLIAAEADKSCLFAGSLIPNSPALRLTSYAFGPTDLSLPPGSRGAEGETGEFAAPQCSRWSASGGIFVISSKQSCLMAG